MTKRDTLDPDGVAASEQPGFSSLATRTVRPCRDHRLIERDTGSGSVVPEVIETCGSCGILLALNQRASWNDFRTEDGTLLDLVISGADPRQRREPEQSRT